MATSSGAAELANTLITTLIAGKNFTIPPVDLSGPIFEQPSDGVIQLPVDKLTTADLTTGQVGGSGVFDQLMVSLVQHLKVEFTANRISGAEYTKAYIGIIAAALQTATQYLLGKDQAYWQAVMVQQQAQLAEIQKVTARIELETARVSLIKVQYEALLAETSYALSKIKLSTEDATFGNLERQGVGLDFTNANLLPQQDKLLKEQTEVQRAQTLDKRSDNTTTVTGLIGQQKDLYAQQITSYKRDAETKFIKMYTDAWITQKTIDEGLVAPTQFTNAQIDSILSKLRGNLTLT